MTLNELSFQYRISAGLLSCRISELEEGLDTADRSRRGQLEERIRALSAMRREARELAVLTERYYDRGYRRNAKYTL